jgi:LSD1 subclass zinc finger protein
MAESIVCPRCRRLLQVPEGHQGRELRCPECQSVFVAGTGTEITAAPPRPEVPGATAVQPGLPHAVPPRSLRHAALEDEHDVSHRLTDHLVVGRSFKPGGGLLLAVKLLLGLSLISSLAMLGSEYLQYNLALRLIAAEDVPFAELDRNDARQLVLGIVHLLIRLATIIVFLCWFYRAHANLEPLGARDLAYTSGWAVGFWFIPIMNLFRPVQVAQEIWRNSDPDAVTDGDADHLPGGNSALIGLWWAAYLISSVIDGIASATEGTSPERLQTATAAAMIAEVASIIAWLLLYAVISAIDARQNARAAALSERI